MEISNIGPNKPWDDTGHLQELLPPGLILKDVIQEEWTSAEGWGVRLYEAVDTRLGKPIERRVRFVCTAGDDVAGKLQEQIYKLSTQSVLRADYPLESGIDKGGLVWMVLQKHQKPLADNPEFRRSGFSPEVAEQLLRQTLEALAALHEAGLCHGQLCPENVDVRSAGDGFQRVVWLTGVELGPMADWSGGALKPSRAHLYFPPEFKGSIREPSPAADVYGAGLVACQMILGKEGKPENFPPESRAKDVRSHLRELFSDKKCKGRLRKVVENLLEPNPTRRPTARQALQQLEGRSILRPMSLVAALVLVCLAVAWFFWFLWGMHRQGNRVEEKLDGLSRVEEDVKGIQRNLGEMERGIIDKIQDACPPAVPGAEKAARSCWQQLWPKHATEMMECNFEKVAEAIPNVARGAGGQSGQSGQQPTPEEIEEQLWTWHKQARDVCSPQVRLWKTRDPVLEEREPIAARRLKSFLEHPWHGPADLRARCDRLEAAAQKWEVWAGNQKMTLEDLQADLAAQPDEERRILNAWLVALERFKPMLELEKETVPGGYGTRRRVFVRAGERKWVQNEEADWVVIETDRATGWVTAEPPNQENVRKIQFEWQPGELLEIWDEEPGVWDTCLIKYTFTGPLALWKAARAGRAYQYYDNAKKWASLEFRIVDQTGKGSPVPGPPPEWKPTLSK